MTEIKNWEGHYTGIQRVISKVGSELVRDGNNFATCYFDYSTNVFRALDYNFATEVVYGKTEPLSLAQRAKGWLIRKAKALKKAAPERLKDPIKSATRVLSLGNVRDTAVNFTAGDTLFIPGAFWIYPIDRLKHVKESGVEVAGVIYDLVPIVVPQFTAKVTVDGFGDRFAAALKTFDRWLAISENSKQDMLNEAELLKVQLHADSVKVIKLGVEVAADASNAHKPDGFNLQPNEFSLFVSTIEARKNQALIYQTVKRLQEQNNHHRPIVLVGKHGWLSDDIIYFLRNDPTIRNSIVWLDRVDDRELQWLYDNCRFTIYPSYYEGWGLPVAESLALGKPCIASNISSIPEVGGNLVEYFSPYSSDELAALIQKYDDDTYLAGRLGVVKGFQPTNWHECAAAVHDFLLLSHK